jgi:hypothetical protein
MCYIPFDRSILQLSNGIRHVMPSRKLELTAKASMAQPVSQPAVYTNGLITFRATFGSLCRYHILSEDKQFYGIQCEQCH